MSVGAVRFGNAGGSTFQSMISKPQTFVKNEVPNASTSIHSGKAKKKSKLVPILLGAAALAGGLALGSKSKIFTQGKLAEKLGSNEIGKKILGGLETAGSKIMEYGGKAISWVKAKLPQAKEAVQEGAEQVAQAAQNAVGG